MTVVITTGMRARCEGTIVEVKNDAGIHEYKIRFGDNRWGWYIKPEFEFVG